MSFTGTGGDDNLVGGEGPDDFDLSQGGNDVANGKAGDDTFYFADDFNELDHVIGGKGNDVLALDGLYGTAVTLSDQNFSGIEQLILLDNTYRFTLLDSAIAAGKTLNIDTGTTHAGELIRIDAQQETNGAIHYVGGSADSTVFTGFGDDRIFTAGGTDIIAPGAGTDVVSAGAGMDTINFHGDLGAADRIDGGDGYDKIVLAGDYSGDATFGRNTLTGIEEIDLGAGRDWVFNLGTLRVGAGGLLITGFSLAADETLHFDGSHAAMGAGAFLDVYGGQGSDVLLGSNGRDRLSGGAGADQLTGNKGDDTFSFHAATDSTGPTYDIIHGFDAHGESLEIQFGGVGVLDPKVNGGHLTAAHFDNQLAAAIGAGELGVSHAVLFQPDSGGLAGKLFLIVNGNAEAGYQAGEDLVIRLDDARHMSDFSTLNFGT